MKFFLNGIEFGTVSQKPFHKLIGFDIQWDGDRMDVVPIENPYFVFHWVPFGFILGTPIGENWHWVSLSLNPFALLFWNDNEKGEQ